ncbi:MAG: acyltransferase, partial [Alloprevotella sp.]
MLTKSDNHLLKGIAILSIMLHNLLHLLPRAVAENEFEFSARNIYRVVYEFHHSHDVWSIISALISHFGHYGVSIFLFLSGYGLVMKYEKSSSSIPPIPSFIWQHMNKLWGLMLPGFVVAFFFLIDWNTFTLQLKDSNPWLTFAFLGNFFKFDTLLYGPWWFFSLMLQFYVLYR